METSGSGVNAIEYAKQAGHTVTYLYSTLYDFTASPDQRKLARKLADHALEVHDMSSTESLLEAVHAAGIRTSDVDAVLSTLAFCAAQAAQLADRIGARGTPLPAVTAARDKGRCREVLRDAGIPSLEFRVVRSRQEALSAAAEIGYPVIIKPVLGVAKAATTIVRTPDEVNAHFAGLTDSLQGMATGMSAHIDERFIVEQLAIGDLCSVEVAAVNGTFVPLATTLQKTGAHNPVLELGCTTPADFPPAQQKELEEYAVKVCRALGLDLGIFHTEVMHTAAGFRLTEVNPRMAGGALPETVNAVADRNMFEILVDLYAGEAAPPEPLRLDGAASHSVLGAATPAAVSEDLPPDWFRAFEDRLHSGWAHVEPGGILIAMQGNFDRFGMIRAVAENADAARAACGAVKTDIERELGVPLVAENTSRLPHSGTG
ncbi:acetyl-CoA carboxylase biotin carboxylase subunit family protein [Streptomyces sp. NPDC051684]|uniref:acetyl-CoA carboxylase biotin carboxylase subunit family protein n=1 Tax=Streptomyces sp. NPDC051684 TaxID=3365670 RepID=UPI0037A4DD07